MSIEKLKENMAGAALSAAASIWGVLAIDAEAEGLAQNWFAAGAKVKTKIGVECVIAMNDFVRAFPTAPEEALWRTISPICGLDPNAWPAQSIATRMGYTIFRRTLLLGDEIIAEAAHLAAVAAQAEAGLIPAAALSLPADEQATGLAESPTGPREGFTLKALDNVSTGDPLVHEPSELAEPGASTAPQAEEAASEAAAQQTEGQPQ